MTDDTNQAAYPDGGETPEGIDKSLFQRTATEVIRLSGVIASIRQELAILEKTFEATQQLAHERFESNALLEQENTKLRASNEELQRELRACRCASRSETVVAVTIPHLTEIFTGVIEVFNAHWGKFDPLRPPKSAAIARALDEKLGWRSQRNGDPSRGAQAFAAAMRPDTLRRADGRNHRPRHVNESR